MLFLYCSKSVTVAFCESFNVVNVGVVYFQDFDLPSVFLLMMASIADDGN